MPVKSSRARSGMFGRAGTVTVIEEPVARNYARMAKVTFWVVMLATVALASVTLSAFWPPLIAGVAGVIIGYVAGVVAAVLVRIWPVIRAVWWWLPEIAIASALVAGWLELASNTGLIVRAVVVVLVLGVPSAAGPVRRRVVAVGWCLVSRHRVRACFSEFIITNRYGTLPLILWARPTPAGERLWICLRPGLSVSDVQDCAEQVAAACWASSVVIDRANPSNSALLRIDIKRRDPLTAVVSSPLTKMAAGFIPRLRPEAQAGPVALDLTDVTAEDVTPAARPAASQRPKWPSAPAAVQPKADEALAGDDINDWI